MILFVIDLHGDIAEKNKHGAEFYADQSVTWMQISKECCIHKQIGAKEKKTPPQKKCLEIIYKLRESALVLGV